MLLFSSLSIFKGKTVVEAHLLADFEKYLIYSFINGYHELRFILQDGEGLKLKLSGYMRIWVP